MTGFLHRLGADFWPLDHSFVAPNLVADTIHWVIIGAVLYVVWPRLRRAANTWMQGHLHAHHLAQVAPHIDQSFVELHQKLDHLIQLALPKEKPMGIAQEVIADIEHRFSFHAASDPNVANAHEAVRALLIDTAKAVIELTPQGREAALVLTKLEEVAFWAHAAIARNMDKVPTVTPPPPAVEPIPEPAVSPNVPAAPADEPAPAVDPAAPVADPTQVDTTVVQPDVVKVDEPAQVAPVEPSPSSPVPDAVPAAAVAPQYFTFTGDPASVAGNAVWPQADVQGANGEVLYTHATSDPIDGSAWVLYSGRTYPIGSPVAAPPPASA